MTRGWWIAVGIVAAANAAAVGGAAWNRQGEPEAVLELTERELELPPAAAENTALALRLRWTDPGNERLVPVEQPSPPVAAAPPPAGGASSPIPQAPPVPAVPAASGRPAGPLARAPGYATPARPDGRASPTGPPRAPAPSPG